MRTNKIIGFRTEKRTTRPKPISNPIRALLSGESSLHWNQMILARVTSYSRDMISERKLII
ncbi:hypothetical protein ACFLQ8_02835 [Candidatus Auribacterota bacterium]